MAKVLCGCVPCLLSASVTAGCMWYMACSTAARRLASAAHCLCRSSEDGGEGRVSGEGEGRVSGEGEGRVSGEGEGRVSGEGEGRVSGEGEGRVSSEGEGRVRIEERE